MQKYFLVFYCLFCISTAAYSQSSYTSLKLFGLSLHPYGDENAHLMPLNPDRKGYLVLNLGAVIGHEIQIKQSNFYVKALQALYADCATQTGGFSHLGFRAIVLKKGKHLLTGGLGPTLIFRRSWYRLPEYEPSSFFNGQPDDKWQYKMLWYGGELEYHYSFSQKFAYSISFVPGFPNIMNLSVGIRYKH